MIIAIIGESCVGKSTLAKKLSMDINLSVYTGKDYLKLAKSEAQATDIFKKILLEKSIIKDENILYLITEKEHLKLLPSNTFKIVMTENLNIIKERFKERTRGILPLPVEKMLEQKHGMFDNEPCNEKIVSLMFNYDELLDMINKHILNQ